MIASGKNVTILAIGVDYYDDLQLKMLDGPAIDLKNLRHLLIDS